MKHTIKSNGDTVDIDVTALADQKAELLDGLQKCQSGTCGCPTDEYKNIESIDVADNDDAIHIQLKAKADAKIDTGEVEKCFDWMKGQAQKD